MHQYVKHNKEADHDWFQIESNKMGTRFRFSLLFMVCILQWSDLSFSQMDRQVLVCA